MSEFFAGAAIGFIAGMALVAYWCYPLLENLREENGNIANLERDFADVVKKYRLPQLVCMDDVTIAKYLATCLAALKTANHENRQIGADNDQ